MIDWVDHGSDFILIAEGKPPSRIALARERMLVSRLYVGLLQTITDDYGADFAAHSDSVAYRTIGIYGSGGSRAGHIAERSTLRTCATSLGF
jgi:hypothetical protein